METGPAVEPGRGDGSGRGGPAVEADSDSAAVVARGASAGPASWTGMASITVAARGVSAGPAARATPRRTQTGIPIASR